VWKKATSKFEAKLKEKIHETLKHIHEITQLEAETNQKEMDPKTEIDEQDLDKMASELEEKVEQLTVEIEEETNPSVHKEIRKKA
jgi:transposase